MIKKCTNLIQEATLCVNDQTDLWQAVNKEFRNFKRNLCSTRPIFEIGMRDISKARFDILQEFSQPTTEESSNVDPNESIVTEADIIDIIHQARGRLLPGFIPYNAVVKIIKEQQKKWKLPALECL